MPPPAPAGGDPGPLRKLDDRKSTVVLPKKGAATVDPKMARPWPADKRAAILSMTQDRLAVLYSPEVSKTIHREASERCLRWAQEDKPKEVADAIQGLQASATFGGGKPLTDAQVHEILIERRIFDRVSPLEPLSVMRAQGLAGDPVVLDRANTGAWSPDPNQAIAAAIPDKPGTYVFAVHRAGFSSSDITTLVVEKKADGTSAVSEGTFSVTPASDLKGAVDAPVYDKNPARDGSRAVLVYPLNPTAVGGKK